MKGYCPCGQPAVGVRQGSPACAGCIEKDAAYYERRGSAVKMEPVQRYYLDKYAAPYRLAGSGMTRGRGLRE